MGYLLVGWPEATRCYPWYGSLADVVAGNAECTCWQVLNLARVWLAPDVQPGGQYYDSRLPGIVSKGVWHSALASTAIRLLVVLVGAAYLTTLRVSWTTVCPALVAQLL
jgi:hypothetical protein